jgi:arginine repressor
MGLNAQKRFRQGQILKLITSEPISSQDELRRRLSHVKVRVTQATLSRDMSELKLVKTSEGYKPRLPYRRSAAPCVIFWWTCARLSTCWC